MAQWIRSRNAVHAHLQDLSSRVVANSGIATDRYHLGKLILQGFKDAPDYLLQIDGATGETEIFESALKRSVQCATAFRKLGIKKGDVVILMAPNHIHLCIPMYAALYIGAISAGIDMALKINEMKETFNINKPSIIFCQNERAADVNLALKDLNFECKIVTFDESDKYLSLTDLLSTYGDGTSVEDFKATDIDPTETIALLVPTSGTTGLPKSAAVTHSNFAISAPSMWDLFNKSPSPTRLSCILSPIQWYSAIFQYVFSPIVRNSRLQSSLPMTTEHAYYIINKYKPTFTMSSPNMWTSLFKVGDRDKCDFSCFEIIFAGGSALPPTLIDAINEVTPNTCFATVYGLSEMSGLVFKHDSTNPKSVGRPAPVHEVRLVSPDTEQDVTEPNVPGELWIKGPAVFKVRRIYISCSDIISQNICKYAHFQTSIVNVTTYLPPDGPSNHLPQNSIKKIQGYYNNPEVTASTFSSDGWFKTGDLFKRDEQWYFYFVERIKMLLKYRNHQISPVELENVIGNHPAVFEVAVTAVPHPEHGDLPVACVVPHKNATVTAQEIKDLVKESLADSKQLRGGVIFLKSLPMTSTSKVCRPLLAALALSSERL